jgi:hypothetical protein
MDIRSRNGMISAGWDSVRSAAAHSRLPSQNLLAYCMAERIAWKSGFKRDLRFVGHQIP